MEENRRATILIATALLFAFFVIYITQLAVGYIVYTFYWGLPLGLLFGLATCLYLSETWDPELLEPTNPKTEKTSFRILWVVPLSVIVARIISQYTNEKVDYLIFGSIFAWIFVTLTYMIIQAWRYRPK